MATYKSSTKKGGRKYIRDLSPAKQLAHYNTLNKDVGYNTTVGRNINGKYRHYTPSTEKDNHYVALPAGWRKSTTTGKWYFENRINRSDDKEAKKQAWNDKMSKARKNQTFKHVIVNQTAVLGKDGQPEYVRYIVKYGDYLHNKSDAIKTVQQTRAMREESAQARIARRNLAIAKRHELEMARKIKAASTPKPTKAQRKAATQKKYDIFNKVQPTISNRGRKPSAGKSGLTAHERAVKAAQARWHGKKQASTGLSAFGVSVSAVPMATPKKLTRSEIARKAAKARWANRK